MKQQQGAPDTAENHFVVKWTHVLLFGFKSESAHLEWNYQGRKEVPEEPEQIRGVARGSSAHDYKTGVSGL